MHGILIMSYDNNEAGIQRLRDEIHRYNLGVALAVLPRFIYGKKPKNGTKETPFTLSFSTEQSAEQQYQLEGAPGAIYILQRKCTNATLQAQQTSAGTVSILTRLTRMQRILPSVISVPAIIM